MPRRRLGRTGLSVSEIGLGGAGLLGRRADLPLEAGVATVRRALARGVNYIDTAECYIDGRSEEVVGAALEGYPGECVVATKFGHRPPDFDYSRESVIASVQESRRLLRGRAIDILQLHTPGVPPLERVFGPGGVLEGMREARDRGWCRFLGITGNDLEFVRRCVDSDAFDTVLTFLCYDLLDQSGEPLLREARARDMGVILGSPLRMGLFGAARNEMLGHATEEQKRRLPRIEALVAGEPGGVTASAIRFALAAPEVAVVLSGACSPEDIDAVIEAAATPLRPELAQAVRRLAEE